MKMLPFYLLKFPAGLAGVVLALLPTLLLVVFGQRFIVRGPTAGAVK